MRFTVVWQTTAQTELAMLWINSDDRERVRAAADRIDEFLRHQSPSPGLALSSSVRRVLIVRPLAVEFAVSDDDRRVTVVQVVRVADRHSP